jgi:hypothetical protein
LFISVKAKAASCQLPSETRQSANTLFNVLCMTVWGSLPYTFLICLCVQPRFIEIYGSSGSVVSFLEGATLRQIYSMPATIRMVYRDRYVVLTRTFKRITHTGSMVRLPFHKGYCGEPTHHIGVSNLSRLLY